MNAHYCRPVVLSGYFLGYFQLVETSGETCHQKLRHLNPHCASKIYLCFVLFCFLNIDVSPFKSVDLIKVLFELQTK